MKHRWEGEGEGEKKKEVDAHRGRVVVAVLQEERGAVLRFYAQRAGRQASYNLVTLYFFFSYTLLLTQYVDSLLLAPLLLKE